MQDICRGDIFYVDLNPTVGSEQSGKRPVVVLQIFVKSSMILVAPISSSKKRIMKTQVALKGVDGLNENSVALLEQIRTIDTRRIIDYIGTVPNEIFRQLIDTYTTVGTMEYGREPTEMTLCGHCAEQYRSSNYRLKRKDHGQEIKESCTFCSVRQGWDYLIYD